MTDQPSEFGGLFSARRVVVVGANGAGKTWLSGRLAMVLNLPLTHNDALVLCHNWTRLPPNDVDAARDKVAQGKAWIIEGGPSVLSGNVLDRTTVVVWLDPPRHIRFLRVLWRTVRFMGRNRPEHPRGNREWPGRRQLRFVVKTWTHDKKTRCCIKAKVAGMRAEVVHLRSAEDVRSCVKAVER